MVNFSGNVIECNDAYKEMLGYTYEELLSKTYFDLTPKKWHALEEKIVKEQVLVDGYSIRAEFRCISWFRKGTACILYCTQAQQPQVITAWWCQTILLSCD